MSALAAQIEQHTQILADHSRRMRRLEDLPREFELFRQQQQAAFAQLREDVTAPLGRLELGFLGLARVMLLIADKSGVEVPPTVRARVARPETEEES